jgi:hypothetical protein
MNKLQLKMSSGRSAAPEKLDPSIVAVREKVLALLADEPMATAMATISDLLSETNDSEMRMGLLSARIKILRRRTEASRRNETPDKMDSIDNIPEPSTKRDLPENLRIDLDALKPVKTDPVFLKILQDCDVNGLHLPKGFEVEVEPKEAESLIASNLAEPMEAKEAEAAEAT